MGEAAVVAKAALKALRASLSISPSGIPARVSKGTFFVGGDEWKAQPGKEKKKQVKEIVRVVQHGNR